MISRSGEKRGLSAAKAMVPALAAAALFGASPPLSKLLLAEAAPLWAASLLYLGAGLGLMLWRVTRRPSPASGVREASLRKKDWGYLAGAIGCGGVLAPFLLMAGLGVTQASAASLLLNLEVVFTALLAWLFFREGFEGRVALGMALVVLGCAVLSLPDKFALGPLTGPLLIAGACLSWALDNNLTRALSERDPTQVAMAKGLAGGAVTALMSVLMGIPLPGLGAVGGFLLLGALAYGLSLVLFIVSLRAVGTVRTGMGFALAPFVGASLSFGLLGDRLSLGFSVGIVIVALGLYFTLAGSHLHEHLHEATVHDHAHVHDEHHRHEHEKGSSQREPHAHPHEHEVLRHAHPHYPDSHHRHSH